MKHLYYGIVLAAMLAACKKTFKENAIEFKTITVNETCPINPQDTVGGGCQVNVNFIYPVAFADSAVLCNVQQELVAFLFGEEYYRPTPEEIIDEYTKSEKDNWQVTHNDLASAFDKTKREVLLNFNVAFNTEVHYNKGGVLAYSVSKSMYEGGAHGLTGRTFLFFDLKTGALITEDDVFKEGYETALSVIFARNLKELISTDEAQDITELDIEDLENVLPNGNFYADEEGVTYLFNQFEITPYDLYGEDIEIFIPYKEIKSVLKSDSPISVFF